MKMINPYMFMLDSIITVVGCLSWVALTISLMIPSRKISETGMIIQIVSFAGIVMAMAYFLLR